MKRAHPALVFLLASAVALPLAAQQKPAFKPDANMERAQVPDGAKWNLTPLFADDKAFEAGLAQAAADRKALAAFHGKLADPAELRACLDLYFRARLTVKKLTLYANLRFVTDQKSAAFQSMSERSQGALGEFMAGTAFLRREVMAIDDRAMEAAYDKEPGLAAYRTYLGDLRRRRSRVLSAEGERVLGLAGDHLWAEIDLNEIPSDFERVYAATRADIALPTIQDEAGKPVELTFSNFPRYRGSPDRRVRRDAVDRLFGALKAYQDVFAATLAGEIKQHVLFARARGYRHALDAYMDKANMDPRVYRALIKAVRANLRPLHRYVALRRKALGLRDVHIYDLYTPLVPSADVTISYEDARRMVVAALAPLGPEYGKLLAESMDPASGWIDAYPHKNKESGAFASFAYGVHPFVKLNFLETFDDVSTLAHEMGHALAMHLAMTRQPYPTSDMQIDIAEIPSTFNEKLLSDYLLRNARNDDERLYLLAHLVETLRTTIYRQTLFAEFELAVATAVENGVPVTAEFLNRTYRDLVRVYYGKGFTIGENDDIEWAYIPHFYYKFYTYAYAVGLSAGVALAEKVQRGDRKARDAYLAFLAAGNTRPPLELVKAAGVDLTRPDAVNAAARLMNRSITEMERILARRRK